MLGAFHYIKRTATTFMKFLLYSEKRDRRRNAICVGRPFRAACVEEGDSRRQCFYPNFAPWAPGMSRSGLSCALVCGTLEKLLWPLHSGWWAEATDLTALHCGSTTGGPQRDPAVCILEVWRAGPAKLWFRSAFGSHEMRLVRVAFLSALRYMLCSALALTLMYDNLCDPVLQLEMRVYPILIFFSTPKVPSSLICRQYVTHFRQVTPFLQIIPEFWGLVREVEAIPASHGIAAALPRDRESRIPSCFADPWFCRHHVELCTWAPRAQVIFWFMCIYSVRTGTAGKTPALPRSPWAPGIKQKSPAQISPPSEDAPFWRLW